MGPLIFLPPNNVPFKHYNMRDHFAGMAMQGMISSIKDQDQLDRMRDWANKNQMSLAQFIAYDSYKQADAMLQARTQPAAYTEELHTEYKGPKR